MSQILATFFGAMMAATTLATFVNLDKEGATLRKHYRSMLRYTTLHKLSTQVQARLNQTQSRADPIGTAARRLLQLQPQGLRKQAAAHSFYALVWSHPPKDLWVETLKEIRQIAKCKCKHDIDAYLLACQQGHEPGRRVTRRILDNSDVCFLKSKKSSIRGILRRMEVRMLEMFIQKMPEKFKKWLQDDYQRELEAFRDALSTPVHDEHEQHAPDQQYHHIPDQQQQQRFKTDDARSEAPQQSMIMLPPSSQGQELHQTSENKQGMPGWPSWYNKLKRVIRKRAGCVTQCNQAAKTDIRRAKEENEDEHRRRLIEWLDNVKGHLVQEQKDQRRSSHEPGHSEYVMVNKNGLANHDQ